jgi:hypothetical protein
VSPPRDDRNLAFYQGLQRRWPTPAPGPEPGAPDPVADSKVVVLITGSIHSTETASTLMTMELLHELATGDDPATRAILDNTILLLVPSANPDGVDKVAAWYERSKGHPWEGGGMPELYHRYAGHDTNRDWFMLNLQETRLLTRCSTASGSRRCPTTSTRWTRAGLGSSSRRSSTRSTRTSTRGSTRRSRWSAPTWRPTSPSGGSAGWRRGPCTTTGGTAATGPRRSGTTSSGVLTEAASVKLASPIFLGTGDLKGGGRGFPDHRPRVNFVDPWPGGWWRLRDVVEYEWICAPVAADPRRAGIARTSSAPTGRWAATRSRAGPPSRRTPGSSRRASATPAPPPTAGPHPHDSGIEVRRASSAFEAAGVLGIRPAAGSCRPRSRTAPT